MGQGLNTKTEVRCGADIGYAEPLVRLLLATAILTIPLKRHKHVWLSFQMPLIAPFPVQIFNLNDFFESFQMR